MPALTADAPGLVAATVEIDLIVDEAL